MGDDLYYRIDEVKLSELPIFQEKHYGVYFFEELDKKQPFIKVGFVLYDEKNKLFRAVYQYHKKIRGDFNGVCRQADSRE